ncbi:MAG: hypothetical protein KJ770_03055 [Actinobacteria bacterium]|nr:hypothetical protein [Actinomycetota bacterium]
MLIASLVGINSRTTMDMDATLRGYPLSEETIRESLLDICAIQLDDEVTIVEICKVINLNYSPINNNKKTKRYVWLFSL